MKPRIVVVDTNVVVSGLISSEQDSPTTEILDAMLEGRFIFLLSVELISEYWNVLRRPAIRRLHRLRNEELERFLVALVSNSIIRTPATGQGRAPNRGDQHLQDLLASEHGSILVSGDKSLLKSKAHKVLSPRDFVALLQTGFLTEES